MPVRVGPAICELGDPLQLELLKRARGRYTVYSNYNFHDRVTAAAAWSVLGNRDNRPVLADLLDGDAISPFKVGQRHLRPDGLVALDLSEARTSFKLLGW